MLLRTAGLTKRFGGLVAVDDVDFALSADECCSLIGPNGAGKTTFFNLLTGSLAPTAGTVEYRDGGDWIDVTGHDTNRTALAGIHRSFQITNIFPTSTVLENVRIAAQAHGGADSWKLHRTAESFTEYATAAYDILERVGLAEEATFEAGTLSHGQKRKLEVAIALAGDPDVLLLDEPTSGVSTDAIDDVIGLIDDVAGDHAILLVEHNMEVVMELSDRIAVLHQGRLIADDDPQAVRDDESVQEAYLGGYDPDESPGTADDNAAGDDQPAAPDGGRPVDRANGNSSRSSGGDDR